MPTRSEKKKRRIKLLVVLIFAEATFILGTTGLGYNISGHVATVLRNIIFGPPVDFSAVLSVSEAYVFFNGTVTRGRPEYYRDAYVYLVAYTPGVSLPNAVVMKMTFDAAERPVYVLPIPRTSGVIAPQDFADVLPDNAKNPVVLLIYPIDKISLVEGWVQGIKDLPQGFYIRIHLVEGKPVSAVSIA
jgi:hypothetical protein